jgi:hypothetical protein
MRMRYGVQDISVGSSFRLYRRRLSYLKGSLCHPPAEGSLGINLEPAPRRRARDKSNDLNVVLLQ